jgi:endonuclease/exonuclease/phosphatase family metal-dependent hydrolase
MQLTFATYNMHKGVGLDGRRDPDRIIAVLREIDADVIALQEADRRFGTRESILERRALDDTPWRHAPVAKRDRSLGWHGNALLVRRTIEITHAEPLDLPTLEPRGAVRADLAFGGRKVRVIGMHLDLSGLLRRQQLRHILAQCHACEDDMPTVLMGDFNQWGRSGGTLSELPDGWAAVGTGPSFPSRRPLAPLDRIIHGPGWHCERSAVHHSALAAIASDHLPVSADLRFHA